MKYVDSDPFLTMTKLVVVAIVAVLTLTGCASADFAFVDSSVLSLKKNSSVVVNSMTNVNYPLREDILSPNYTGGYELNFINQSNFNSLYAAYDLIRTSIHQLPFKDKRVEFVYADKLIVLRLNNEDKAWAPNYSMNIKGECFVESAAEWSSHRRLQRDDYWRNLIISPSKQRVLCVDRLTLKGNFYAIVYIVQAEKKAYPFPTLYHWDVTQPELPPNLWVTLLGFADITKNIIKANQ